MTVDLALLDATYGDVQSREHSLRLLDKGTE
jgi:hypothetical protein